MIKIRTFKSMQGGILFLLSVIVFCSLAVVLESELRTSHLLGKLSAAELPHLSCSYKFIK